MKKRGSEHSSDGDSPKKKKTPPRNDGQTKVVMAEVMKYFGIKGEIREFTIPANLESVCKVLDRKINGTETVHERIERTVTWVSKLKSEASLFANWLLLHQLHVGQDIPTLGRPFFCEMMAAVTKRPSQYQPQYQLFSQATGHQCLEWQPGNAQILEHARAEMVTVASTYLVNNFFTKKLMFLRWKVADALSAHLLSLPQKNAKKLLYAITQRLLLDGGRQLEDFHGIVDFPQEQVLRTRIFNLAQQNLHDMTSLKTRLGDRLRDKWIAKKMAASKSRTQPVTREEVVEKFNALSLHILIKEDPIGVLYYYHEQHALVQHLNLTTLYQDHVNKMKEEKESEEKKQSTWPFWKRLKLPSFSPLPFNKTSRQFIRIDKKTLQEWHLTLDAAQDLWMNSIFSLYSSKKRGRIHQFYEWRHLHRLESVQLILQDDRDRGRFDPAMHRPTLPGASFTTDGIAVHISAYSFPSKHPNVANLPERGYGGVISKTKVRLQDHDTGVFKLESMRTFNTVQEYGECDLIGVDPGCIEVVAHARIAIEESHPLDTEAARRSMLDRSESGSYSETLYKKNTGRLQAEEKERWRRQNVATYKASLEMLNGVHRKTFDLQTMTLYATARCQAEPGMVQELLNKKRSIHRRKRFVRIQRTIAHIAHTIGGGPSRSERRVLRKKMDEMLERKKVIFFGRGQWTGVKGHVTVPRKKLIHVLACNNLVLLVDEYCTSKLCPYDFEPLQDMGDRIRQCQTENHGATADQLFTTDRDVIGSMNILQKGVFHLLGRPLRPLYQSDQAA